MRYNSRMDNAVKACTKCGETKPLDKFFRRADRSSGYKSCCKICSKQISLQSKTPEKVRAWRNSWAARNREKVRALHKLDYEKNSSSYKKRSKDWAELNVKARKSINTKYQDSTKYVATQLAYQLGINRSQIPHDLIEAKRAHLKLARKLKELSNENT